MQDINCLEKPNTTKSESIGIPLLGPVRRPQSLRQKVLKDNDYKPRPHSVSNHSATGIRDQHMEHSRRDSDEIYKMDQYFNPEHRLLLRYDAVYEQGADQLPPLDKKIRTYCIDHLNALNKFNKHDIISHNSRMGASFLKSSEGKILYYDNKSKVYSFWALFSWKHSILSKRQTWIHLAMYILFMLLSCTCGLVSGLAKSIQVVRVSEDVIIILVIFYTVKILVRTTSCHMI